MKDGFVFLKFAQSEAPKVGSFCQKSGVRVSQNSNSSCSLIDKCDYFYFIKCNTWISSSCTFPFSVVEVEYVLLKQPSEPTRIQ